MILEIYVWSIVFVYLNIASWSWYVNENLQRIAFYRLILGAILNFILNIFLIREHGLEGAAMATIFSYAIASYFGNLISSKTRVNFILQTKALLHVFDLKSYFK